MECLLGLVVVLILLLIPFNWLDKQKWAQFITKPMKKYSLALAKHSLKLVAKLLRKVTSLFDPY